MLDPEVQCAPCDENDRTFERLAATILQLRGVRGSARWSAVRADTTVHRTPKMYETPTDRNRQKLMGSTGARENDNRHTERSWPKTWNTGKRPGNPLLRACDEMGCRRPPLPIHKASIRRSGAARTKVRGAGEQSEAPIHSSDRVLPPETVWAHEMHGSPQNRGGSPPLTFSSGSNRR